MGLNCEWQLLHEEACEMWLSTCSRVVVPEGAEECGGKGGTFGGGFGGGVQNTRLRTRTPRKIGALESTCPWVPRKPARVRMPERRFGSSAVFTSCDDVEVTW